MKKQMAIKEKSSKFNYAFCASSPDCYPANEMMSGLRSSLEL